MSNAGATNASTSMDLASGADLPPGARIGKCVILGTLGKGGMGAVYRAKHVSLDIEVALKVILFQAASEEEKREQVARFLREARAAAKVRHEGVIQVLDVDAEGSLHYMVMEVVDGVSARKLCQGKALDVPEAARVIRDAARALAAAHRMGIVHRDVKPENILLTREGRVKVSDFGIAHVGGARESKLTRTGQIIGTPHYMSPEQVDGLELDGRADIYALGASLFHLITGSTPFDGPSALQVCMKHLSAPVPSSSQRNPAIPPELDAIIARMMAKQPAERYATADDVAEALEPFAGPRRAVPEGLAPPAGFGLAVAGEVVLASGAGGASASDRTTPGGLEAPRAAATGQVTSAGAAPGAPSAPAPGLQVSAQVHISSTDAAGVTGQVTGGFATPKLAPDTRKEVARPPGAPGTTSGAEPISQASPAPAPAPAPSGGIGVGALALAMALTVGLTLGGLKVAGVIGGGGAGSTTGGSAGASGGSASAGSSGMSTAGTGSGGSTGGSAKDPLEAALEKQANDLSRSLFGAAEKLMASTHASSAPSTAPSTAPSAPASPYGDPVAIRDLSERFSKACEEIGEGELDAGAAKLDLCIADQRRQKLTVLDSLAASGVYQLAFAYERAGRPKEALAAGERMLAEYPSAPAGLTKAVSEMVLRLRPVATAVESTFEVVRFLAFEDAASFHIQLEDVDGDGRRDVVICASPAGYFCTKEQEPGALTRQSVPIEIEDEKARESFAARTLFGVGPLAKGEPIAFVTSTHGNRQGELALWRRTAGAATYAEETLPAGPQRRESRAPSAVLVADLTGDGRAELIACALDGPEIEVRRGLPEGGFSEPAVLGLAGNLERFALADVTGDGRPEIVALTTGQKDSNKTQVTCYSADADLRFFPAPTAPRMDASWPELAAGDWSGDGLADLVMTAGPKGKDRSLAAWRGKGKGTLEPGGAALELALPPKAPVLVDADGDGKRDLVLTLWSGSEEMTLLVFLSKGDGTFQASQKSVLLGLHSVRRAYAEDLDGDGKPDLVLLDYYRGAAVLFGDGKGHFGNRE